MKNEIDEKKVYVAPAMKEVELAHRANLLDGSDPSDPPEHGGEFD